MHRYEPATGIDATRGMPGRPGALALGREPGELVIAMEHELVRWRWEEPTVFEPVRALEAAGTGNRLNDGRTDPAGRFVVGSMWADSAAGAVTGSMYSIDADDSTTLRTGVGCPNGLAFDVDRGRVYWTDTPTERVVVADYDPATGAWENERLFLDYADLPGKPDGACVDAEGGYWSASVYGWAVIRVSPEGTVDERIELPVEKPSMPAFGGPDLSELYITTGVHKTVEEEHAGRLFKVHGLGVKGLPSHRFGE